MEFGIEDLDPRHPKRQLRVTARAVNYLGRLVSTKRHVELCQQDEPDHEQRVKVSWGRVLGLDLAERQLLRRQKQQEFDQLDPGNGTPRATKWVREAVKPFLAIDPTITYEDMGLSREHQVLIGTVIGQELLDDFALSKQFGIHTAPRLMANSIARMQELDPSITYREMHFTDEETRMLEEKAWPVYGPS